MLRKKCPRCRNKISKKFDFCPHCGNSLKKQNEEDDFGMLGRDDLFGDIQEQIKMRAQIFREFEAEKAEIAKLKAEQEAKKLEDVGGGKEL